MNYAQLFAEYEERLEMLGEEAEALSFTFRGLKGLNLTDFLLTLRKEVTKEDQDLIATIFQNLSQHIPAQYIIGHTLFHGLKLEVNPHVLIPRPETEELVELILKENKDAHLRVLDIGTGSGAIALALAQARPDWQLTALDISPEALAVAKRNAQANHLTVNFQESDVLEQVMGTYDIIVSNPPYISKKDTNEVGLNVLHSEPHLALFAAEDGLAIYRKIAEQAGDYLTPGGKIYLEIGYKQGQAVSELFQQQFPEKRVRIIQDAFSKDRKAVVDDAN
ncbi:peptide chain release factor N(5)-glutamine methyltransferase [Streptococcus oriscaviae]|uniref:Release factor glutamine methyltransferase n=1 Tax=Streptococcus oriscaviae TaxID=2781599 RepID=A0ABX7YMP7_9STRE|nr:peptide chain release factor N(5)-glutamine methyltransferase [Streptococcus oriscaviae]QUE54599.1 peptide chain release factor N(5)-glutamine methyltransferase [Streptococcus oriscaviae]